MPARVLRAFERPRLLVVVALTVALTAATTAIVVGAGPSNPGPFTGCLSAKGQISSVAVSPDTPASNCRNTETQITFSNAQGPQGEPGVGGPGVVAASRVGPDGDITIPGGFAFGGARVRPEVDVAPAGLYLVTFDAFDPDRRYVLTGAVINDLDGAARTLELVVDGSLDASLGLYVRIRNTAGTPVNAAFTFEIVDFTDFVG